MNLSRKKLVAIAATAAIMFSGAGTESAAASADQTPPTAPFIVYSQGFSCYTFYIGASRSTDDVTPEPQLRYEVFANGELIGLLDRGSATTAWGNLKLRDEGPNQIYVEAIDAAGNRSRSNTGTAIGYDCVV